MKKKLFTIKQGQKPGKPELRNLEVLTVFKHKAEEVK